ncbi:hypothetical protein B0O99DRAFT_690791 [Bisporella sp. PMI_857]|nr:hypothetical protein B0O99DRAFT_690791 [Bisporella sp. PMI_857]
MAPTETTDPQTTSSSNSNQPEDAQPEDAQPEDAQPEDAQPEDAQPEDAQPEAVQNQFTDLSIARPGEDPAIRNAMATVHAFASRNKQFIIELKNWAGWAEVVSK